MGSTSTSLTVSYVELLSNLWGDGEKGRELLIINSYLYETSFLSALCVSAVFIIGNLLLE